MLLETPNLALKLSLKFAEEKENEFCSWIWKLNSPSNMCTVHVMLENPSAGTKNMTNSFSLQTTQSL
jgi:hypothetical protein